VLLWQCDLSTDYSSIFRKFLSLLFKWRWDCICAADGNSGSNQETMEDDTWKRSGFNSIFMFSNQCFMWIARPIKGCSGILQIIHPGKYLVAWHPKSSTENDANYDGSKTQMEQKFLVRTDCWKPWQEESNVCISRASELAQGWLNLALSNLDSGWICFWL